jgi:hypothetical protein
VSVFFAERGKPNQIEEHTSSTGIVGPIMEAGYFRVFPTLVPSFNSPDENQYYMTRLMITMQLLQISWAVHIL